jgi:hypothetical protein
MRFPSLRPAVFVFTCVMSTFVHAQPFPGGAGLGMTPGQLQQAVEGLQHVARPARLAGGLVGSWSAPALRIAGVRVTPTFFLAGGQVARIEYLAATDGSPADFDALVGWGRAAWGNELVSQSPEGDYATWSRDDLDAYVQRTNTARVPQLRLVIKRVVAKDAETL